ncbi:phospholipase D-like domain-containing protein [Burkholderia contaminans]|uniref:phospholipase D-like domain-containing protein n=1 Tax=Burkholderia contaminans TaxID=488447 RepID=UPI0024167F2C|nr:phospholipase D-like domain-containing protein [Burkholderia contaminans]WFN13297.1 phospholipase D-like domain-containing protein [Burkholderia contaminans]
MADFPLKTHKSSKVAIDEKNRQAKGSLQWLLEGRDKIPITRGNTLSFIVNSEDGFKSIAKDLKEAKATADIICWGFDPGMELERSGGTWRRGQTYGELLDEITQRKENPVMVRLLVWYEPDPAVWSQANNMPGFTDSSDYYPNKWALSSPYDSQKRQDYCIAWWAKNLPKGRSNAGANPNLRVVLRSVSRNDAIALLSMRAPTVQEDEDSRGKVEEIGFEMAATHHQKPVLIDYDYDQGSKAIGYVMGLNSVTDYWDGSKHEVDDERRERWAPGALKDEASHQKSAEGTESGSVYEHSKPFQDYACRIQGPALAQLKYNFENGWAVALERPLPFDKPPAPPAKIKTVSGSPAHLVQIVRTQPHELEKSIKEIYFQASSCARNYIYMENQYFFYPEFARHLTKTRKEFCDNWTAKSHKPVTEMPKLHLFIVIPHPERNQMIPRTYDTLTGLGYGQKVDGIEAMAEQRALSDKGKLDQKYPNSHKGPKGGQVLDRPSVQDLERQLGLEVTVARLRTSGPDAKGNMAYREIYIHSKLMIIDDAFITVGSANLNQRSMSVDSEINIAATGSLYAADLRKRVFKLHSGEENEGSNNPSELPDKFKLWKKTMNDNLSKMRKKQPMTGFLLPFEDHRSTTQLLGQVDVPSSSGTETA